MTKAARKFSASWKASRKPKKQRKYRYNAPYHTKSKFLSAHLSRDLRKKYQKRSVRLRKGDKVLVISGEFRKKEGKIESIITKNLKVRIEGIEKTKKDGTKARVPVDPSNLIVTELALDDKRRQEVLERK